MIRVNEDLRLSLGSNESLPLETVWVRANQGLGTWQAISLSSHSVNEDEVSLSDRAMSLPSKAAEYHANEGSWMLCSVRSTSASSSDGVGLAQAIGSLGIVVSQRISAIRLTLCFPIKLLHSRTSS